MTTEIRKINNNNKIDQMANDYFLTQTCSGIVEIGVDNFVLPMYYEKHHKKISNFEVRDSDVFVIGHPKTGTTWMQEMVWLIVNNLDYEGAKKEVYQRVSYFETCAHYDVDISDLYGKDYKTYFEEKPSPRCFKTHLHWSLLPEQIQNGSKKPKIVCLLRSPEDVCVSYYHHSKLMEGYKGSFEEFCQLFLAGRTIYGPFWKSVLSVWKERRRSNIMFVKYADMKKDLTGVIRRVGKFLERNLNDNEVDDLAKHLGFNEMKQNSAVNQKLYVELYAKKFNLKVTDNDFIRKGVVGGYKNEMTDEQVERFQKWTEKELERTDLQVE